MQKPRDVTLMIQEGQDVDLMTPYYKKNTSEPVKIPVATLLKFPPEKIFMSLHKLVGEEIKKGDVIADYKGIFGIREYLSEYSGVISEINHHDGSITIDVQSKETNTVSCPFHGKIDEITPDSVVLNVKEGKSYSIEQVSHIIGGNVFYYTDQTKSKVSEEAVEHTVVVAKTIPAYDQVKMEALGARSFITLEKLPEKTSLPAGRISKIEDYKNISSSAHPYCIIGSDKSKITFYS